MRSVALPPRSRERALEAMAATSAGSAGTELDILVVGGGVVGAGAALDAATRGLTVGLVEARDFASGTSSRSSKLIHGGLRYLEMLDFGLVAEALQERGLLIRKLAPHLIKPVPFVYPLVSTAAGSGCTPARASRSTTPSACSRAGRGACRTTGISPDAVPAGSCPR